MATQTVRIYAKYEGYTDKLIPSTIYNQRAYVRKSYGSGIERYGYVVPDFSSIPEGAVITSAILYMNRGTAYSAYYTSVTIRYATTPVDIVNGFSWNTQPTAITGTSLTKAVMSATVNWDVTNNIKAMFDTYGNTMNHPLVLEPSGSGTDTYYTQFNYGSANTYIDITYEEPVMSTPGSDDLSQTETIQEVGNSELSATEKIIEVGSLSLDITEFIYETGTSSIDVIEGINDVYVSELTTTETIVQESGFDELPMSEDILAPFNSDIETIERIMYEEYDDMSASVEVVEYLTITQTVNIPISRDFYVDLNSTSSNYESSTSLNAKTTSGGKVQIAYMIPNFTSLPRDAVVNRATLKVRASGSFYMGETLGSSPSPTTWSNKPSHTMNYSRNYSYSGSVVDIDVTTIMNNLVKYWYTGRGFVFESATGSSASFYSIESSVVPYVEVTFTAPQKVDFADITVNEFINKGGIIDLPVYESIGGVDVISNTERVLRRTTNGLKVNENIINTGSTLLSNGLSVTDNIAYADSDTYIGELYGTWEVPIVFDTYVDEEVMGANNKDELSLVLRPIDTENQASDKFTMIYLVPSFKSLKKFISIDDAYLEFNKTSASALALYIHPTEEPCDIVNGFNMWTRPEEQTAVSQRWFYNRLDPDGTAEDGSPVYNTGTHSWRVIDQLLNIIDLNRTLEESGANDGSGWIDAGDMGSPLGGGMNSNRPYYQHGLVMFSYDANYGAMTFDSNNVSEWKNRPFIMIKGVADVYRGIRHLPVTETICDISEIKTTEMVKTSSSILTKETIKSTSENKLIGTHEDVLFEGYLTRRVKIPMAYDGFISNYASADTDTASYVKIGRKYNYDDPRGTEDYWGVFIPSKTHLDSIPKNAVINFAEMAMEKVADEDWVADANRLREIIIRGIQDVPIDGGFTWAERFDYMGIDDSMVSRITFKEVDRFLESSTTQDPTDWQYVDVTSFITHFIDYNLANAGFLMTSSATYHTIAQYHGTLSYPVDDPHVLVEYTISAESGRSDLSVSEHIVGKSDIMVWERINSYWEFLDVNEYVYIDGAIATDIFVIERVRGTSSSNIATNERVLTPSGDEMLVYEKLVHHTDVTVVERIAAASYKDVLNYEYIGANPGVNIEVREYLRAQAKSELLVVDKVVIRGIEEGVFVLEDVVQGGVSELQQTEWVKTYSLSILSVQEIILDKPISEATEIVTQESIIEYQRHESVDGRLTAMKYKVEKQILQYGAVGGFVLAKTLAPTSKLDELAKVPYLASSPYVDSDWILNNNFNEQYEIYLSADHYDTLNKWYWRDDATIPNELFFYHKGDWFKVTNMASHDVGNTRIYLKLMIQRRGKIVKPYLYLDK